MDFNMRLFETVYYVEKHHSSFLQFVELVQLQKTNELDIVFDRGVGIN